MEAGDELGLFRTNYWFEHGTLGILKAGVSQLGEFRESIPRLEELLRKGKVSLEGLKTGNNPLVHLEKTFVLEEPNTLSKKHIFRVNKGGRILFTEAFEYVTGLESEETIRQAVCLPTAVGCAMACRMCDLGTFYGGELSKEAILQMMERVIDVHTVGWKNPSHIKIVYLGGGEPANNKELLDVVEVVGQKYEGCTQVVSTVGVRNGFNEGLIKVARDTNVGFQVSLYSLDDEVRDYIVNKNNTLNVDESLSVLNRYHQATGQRGRMAIVLLEGVHNDLDKTERQIGEKVDGDSVHISLQTLSESNTGFAHRTVPVRQYEILRKRLQEKGYSVSIYNPPQLAFKGSCGVVSDSLLAKVAPYKKRVK